MDILPDVPIHIIVPIIVVDELDRLKESSNRFTRWRAGYSLAALDRLLQAGLKWAVLTPAHAPAVQEVVTVD